MWEALGKISGFLYRLWAPIANQPDLANPSNHLDRTMVTTRSQERDAEEEMKSEDHRQEPTASKARKRKRPISMEAAEDAMEVAKPLALRPHKASDVSEGDGSEPQSTLKQTVGPLESETPAAGATDGEYEPLSHGIRSIAPAELELPELKTSSPYPELRSYGELQVVESTQELAPQNVVSSETGLHPMLPEGPEERLELEQAARADPDHLGNGKADASDPVLAVMNGTAAARQHVRFGSEDPAAAEPIAAALSHQAKHLRPAAVALQDAIGSSDDDATPETLDAAAGQAQARAVTSGAARASQRQAPLPPLFTLPLSCLLTDL